MTKHDKSIKVYAKSMKLVWILDQQSGNITTEIIPNWLETDSLAMVFKTPVNFFF